MLTPWRPNVSAIPHADMGSVRTAVTNLLKAAGLVEADYSVTHLEKVDLPALNALNAGVQYDLRLSKKRKLRARRSKANHGKRPLVGRR